MLNLPVSVWRSVEELPVDIVKEARAYSLVRVVELAELDEVPVAEDPLVNISP